MYGTFGEMVKMKMVCLCDIWEDMQDQCVLSYHDNPLYIHDHNVWRKPQNDLVKARYHDFYMLLSRVFYITWIDNRQPLSVPQSIFLYYK